MGLIHGYRKQRLSVAVTLGGNGNLMPGYGGGARFSGSAWSGVTVGVYNVDLLLKEDQMFDKGKLPLLSWLGGLYQP